MSLLRAAATQVQGNRKYEYESQEFLQELPKAVSIQAKRL